MVIDTHEHVMEDSKIQIENMEKAGVDKVILFCTTPHPESAANLDELKDEMNILYKNLEGGNTKEENIRKMKRNIKALTNVLKKYPNKFYGFGSVPLGLSLKETTDWIENNILANSLKGVGEFTPGSLEQMQQMEVVFEALENSKILPIWIHTFDPVTLEEIEVLMDITKKHPKVPVIFGHMGGYNWMKVIEFARTVPNVYLDFSAAFSTLAVKMAIIELPERCLYASDAPYGDPLISKQLVEYLSPSEDIKNKILSNNILELLGE